MSTTLSIQKVELMLILGVELAFTYSKGRTNTNFGSRTNAVVPNLGSMDPLVVHKRYQGGPQVSKLYYG